MTINETLPIDLSGRFVTATVTSDGPSTDTSEFSNCIEAVSTLFSPQQREHDGQEALAPA